MNKLTKEEILGKSKEEIYIIIPPFRKPTLIDAIKALEHYCSIHKDYYGKPFTPENRAAANSYLISLKERYANGER